MRATIRFLRLSATLGRLSHALNLKRLFSEAGEQLVTEDDIILSSE